MQTEHVAQLLLKGKLACYLQVKSANIRRGTTTYNWHIFLSFLAIKVMAF